MIFGIGNIQRLTDKRHPLGMIKLCFRITTVVSANHTRPDDIDQFAIERTDNETVMVTVRNKYPTARFIHQDLPRKLERFVLGLVSFEIEPDRRFVQRSF